MRLMLFFKLFYQALCALSHDMVFVCCSFFCCFSNDTLYRLHPLICSPSSFLKITFFHLYLNPHKTSSSPNKAENKSFYPRHPNKYIKKMWDRWSGQSILFEPNKRRTYFRMNERKSMRWGVRGYKMGSILPSTHNNQMSQHQILANRVLNCIEQMKYQLPEDEEVSDLFNDLLILRHIVPGLPKDTIRSLLHELKPHTACDASVLDCPVDFAKINIILSQVKRPSQLLTDFLACSGVVPVGTA